METMPEWAKYLIAIGGTFAGLILTYIAAAVMGIGKKQTEQGTDIAVIKNDMSGMNKKIESLHDWRNQLQKEELANVKDELKRLKGTHTE